MEVTQKLKIFVSNDKLLSASQNAEDLRYMRYQNYLFKKEIVIICKHILEKTTTKIHYKETDLIVLSLKTDDFVTDLNRRTIELRFV